MLGLADKIVTKMFDEYEASEEGKQAAQERLAKAQAKARQEAVSYFVEKNNNGQRVYFNNEADAWEYYDNNKDNPFFNYSVYAMDKGGYKHYLSREYQN